MQIMPRTLSFAHRRTFSLLPEIHEPIREMIRPESYHINVSEHIVGVKKGAIVNRGEVLAQSIVPGRGTLHAPEGGKVTRVDAFYLVITPSPKSASAIEPRFPDKKTPRALERFLDEMGVDTSELRPAKTLIVNGMNTEPGLQVDAQILDAYRETLETGLELIEAIVRPEKRILALPRGDRHRLGDLRMVGIDPIYPKGLSPLVAARITGKESDSRHNDSDVLVLDMTALYHIGCVAQSGVPMAHTLMTINGINYRVTIGTPVRTILDHLEMTVQPDDRVILGGPLRGRTLYSLDQGVTRGDHGLFVIPAGSNPEVKDTPCLGCGECVRHCPARLRPDLITRYAQFGLFDRIDTRALDSCFECGLCGFYCPVPRPMLQYIRFAKEVQTTK